MKTISKYNYLQKLITKNAKEYRKVILQIPEEEYNNLYGISNTTTSYSYSNAYAYTYTYSYNNAYTYSYNNSSTLLPVK